MFTKRELSGISQKIANLDNIMANLKVKPILINGINLHNKGDVDDLKSKAFMWYSNATLEGDRKSVV